MRNFTVAIAKCSYMFWLDKVAILRLYISEVQKGNYTRVVYI